MEKCRYISETKEPLSHKLNKKELFMQLKTEKTEDHKKEGLENVLSLKRIQQSKTSARQDTQPVFQGLSHFNSVNPSIQQKEKSESLSPISGNSQQPVQRLMSLSEFISKSTAPNDSSKLSKGRNHVLPVDNAVKLFHLIPPEKTEERIHALDDVIKASETYLTTSKGAAERLKGVEQLKMDAITDKHLLTLDLADQKDQGNYDTVIARHEKDRKLLQKWIDEGEAQNDDIRLKNSCEWINSGKVKIFMSSETHDSKKRFGILEGVPKGKIPAGAVTYFPDSWSDTGHLKDGVGKYNRKDLSDRNNVETDSEGHGTVGWNAAGKMIAVTEAGMAGGKAYVWETLRHEVQHDADMHQKTEKPDDIKGMRLPKPYRDYYEKAKGIKINKMTDDQRKSFFIDAKKSILEGFSNDLEGYKTEYRAYSYEGSPETDKLEHDPKKLTENHEGYKWTKRQLHVFNKIYSDYAYVEDAWDDDRDYFKGKYFCDKVNAYVNPDSEGVNKYNSLRIDKLYRALQGLEKETDVDPVTNKVINPEAPRAKTAIRAVGYLNDHDLKYLKDDGESVLLNRMINERLDGDALKAFKTKLSDMSSDSSGDLTGGLFK